MAIGQLSLHLLLSVIKGYRYYSSILYVLLSVLWSCPWPSGRGQLHIVRRVLYKLAGTWYDKGLEGTIGSTGTYSMYSMIYRELETVPIPMFEQSEGKNCSASMCLWCESKELACSALPYQQSWARVIFFNESRVTALCCFTDASLVTGVFYRRVTSHRGVFHLFLRVILIQTRHKKIWPCHKYSAVKTCFNADTHA